MYSGKLVFAHVMDHLPLHTFHRCVQRFGGHRRVRSFSCLDQFLCMAFAQITGRRSLRDLEICLRAQSNKLYHMGIRGGIARSTLADANEVGHWRIGQDFAQALIRLARPLYRDEDLGLALDYTVNALDPLRSLLPDLLGTRLRHLPNLPIVGLDNLVILRHLFRQTLGTSHSVVLAVYVLSVGSAPAYEKVVLLFVNGATNSLGRDVSSDVR